MGDIPFTSADDGGLRLLRRFLGETEQRLPSLRSNVTRHLWMGRYHERAINKEKVDAWVVWSDLD